MIVFLFLLGKSSSFTALILVSELPWFTQIEAKERSTMSFSSVNQRKIGLPDCPTRIPTYYGNSPIKHILRLLRFQLMISNVNYRKHMWNSQSLFIFFDLVWFIFFDLVCNCNDNDVWYLDLYQPPGFDCDGLIPNSFTIV